MSRARQILEFYQSLNLENSQLPAGVEVMNPYQEAGEEVPQVISQFYHKFYNDNQNRGLILGINPGRMGAGLTGIPFTDSYRLEEHCGIPFPGQTRETSSLFVYDVIEAYGGAQKFYHDWFIGAVSPLGFIHKNAKGNWVNYNYYDNKELEKAVRPFIVENLRRQREICGMPGHCIVLGTGKNFQYLKRLNEKVKLFDRITPLEHPRYIMQYKLKKKAEYCDKFLGILQQPKAKS